MKTYLPVIFRRWKSGEKTVIALFPTIPGDARGIEYQSYEHVGQHGGAWLPGIIANTMPANPSDADVTSLWRELISIGYDNLRPFRRAKRQWDDKRRADARVSA